jgi:hypothetical protein
MARTLVLGPSAISNTTSMRLLSRLMICGLTCAA